MTIFKTSLLIDLLSESKDGEWGEASYLPDYRLMGVIRGADFESCRLGNMENLPRRFIPKRISERKELRTNDIVIETAGGTAGRPTGRTLLIQDSLIDQSEIPLICASFSRFLRPDESKVYAPYLYWYLQYLYHSGQMGVHQIQHTGVARFQYTDFSKSTLIPIPPISIQHRIASILGSLDDKIELNRRMNETLEQMAMALYKHWFIDFGPFQDGEFVESELGMIPKKWEIRSLYSMADFINGMIFKQSDFCDRSTGLPVIRIAELNNGITGSTNYYDASFKEKYRLNNGDILFAWSASLGVYLWAEGQAILNQHIFNVKENGGLPLPILFFVLKHVVDEFMFIAASRATTMGHITIEHLESKLILCPPAEILKKITNQLEPLYKLILSNKIEIELIKGIRNYLLPRLLSGEIALDVVEKHVQEVMSDVNAPVRV